MIIKHVGQDAFQVAAQWAANEGWNPGHDDLAAFFTADPDGFLMGYIDDQPVASISVVRYGENFGFLGFYIVAPAHRGKGLGWQIWQAGMAYLEGRTVGLDGVVEQQGNYEKSGFAFAHNNIRFAGSIAENQQVSSHIVPADQLDVSLLVAHDRHFFPTKRSDFFTTWASSHSKSRWTLAFMDEGKISGLGTIRKCQQGFKIGPLYADEPDIAEAVFLALANHAKGEVIFLDVPQPNDQAVALAQKYGLKPTFETARMYQGSKPELPLDNLYGITTFELG